jgi:hypothetical protein
MREAEIWVKISKKKEIGRKFQVQNSNFQVQNFKCQIPRESYNTKEAQRFCVNNQIK